MNFLKIFGITVLIMGMIDVLIMNEKVNSNNIIKQHEFYECIKNGEETCEECLKQEEEFLKEEQELVKKNKEWDEYIEELEKEYETTYEEDESVEEKITDEEIRNAYYNMPNFKGTFMKLQDEHETLAHIKKRIPRGNNAEHVRECIENADEWTLEDVEKIQVQGKVLEKYKWYIMEDCRRGNVPTTSNATELANRIWDIICDIEIKK